MENKWIENQYNAYDSGTLILYKNHQQIYKILYDFHIQLIQYVQR